MMLRKWRLAAYPPGGDKVSEWW